MIRIDRGYQSGGYTQIGFCFGTHIPTDTSAYQPQSGCHALTMLYRRGEVSYSWKDLGVSQISRILKRKVIGVRG